MIFLYICVIVITMKKVVVIGGSGGIGKAICQELADKCDTLVIQGQSKTNLQLLKTELSTKTDVQTISFNFNNSFFTDTSTEKKNLINLIQNADGICVCFGPFLQKPLHLMTSEDWVTISNMVFALPSYLCSLVLPSMLKNHFGRILLFGGTRTDSINGFKTNAAYAAAKTGICSLVKSITMQYAADGITCNAILPGFVDTEYISQEQRDYYKTLLKSQTLISTQSIAKQAMNLFFNPDMNGTLLRIDRGWEP